MRTASKIRRFIERNLLDEPANGVDPLREGMVDSMGIEQLAAWAEETFDIAFDDDDFVIENFNSIGSFSSLVKKKRRER